MNSLLGFSSMAYYLSMLMQLFVFLIITGLVMFAVWLFKHVEKATVFIWSIGFFFIGLIGAILVLWIMSNNTQMMY